MKICYASDIHLDRASCFITNPGDAKVLVLAGDILELRDLQIKSELSYDRYDEFFKCVSDEFEYVLWVFGNHEYYGTDLISGPEFAQRYIDANGFGNIKILKRNSIQIDDVTFHGATLWTDYNRDSPLVKLRASLMADFKMTKLRNRGEKVENFITPDDILDEFNADLGFIKKSLVETKTDKNVVITHHCPFLCGHFDEYSYFYKSDLMDTIYYMDRQPDFWLYGHTHRRETYSCGKTLITTNPRGYVGHDSIAKHFKIESIML